MTPGVYYHDYTEDIALKVHYSSVRNGQLTVCATLFNRHYGYFYECRDYQIKAADLPLWRKVKA